MIFDIDQRFDYHRPNGIKVSQHEQVRKHLKDAALDVIALTPPGREQALALTKLEEAMFWANAAIARERLAE